MKKQEFLERLKVRLSVFSRGDVRERVNFYSEMIDDRMEEGLSEEEAVEAVGSLEEIASQISAENRLSNPKKSTQRCGGLKTWEIIILILGFPIWGSLLIAFFAVVWSLNLTLWAIELPFFIFSYVSRWLLVACIWTTKVLVFVTVTIVGTVKKIFS